MNFEEEQWIKLYIRDTPRWLATCWQAKALMPLLMRKLDRRGSFDCDGLDLATALSVATGLPGHVVTTGLHGDDERPGLIASGTVEISAGGLTVPNFVGAQRARTSDAERKRRQRERNSGDEKSPEKTASMSHAVTRGHTASRIDRSERIERREEIDPPIAPPGGPSDACSGSGRRRVSEPRGTRLPDDWTPGAEVIEWARREGIPDPLAALPEFRDYWRGVPGARGRKVDWDGTYRNRLRDIAKRGSANRPSGTFRRRLILQQPPSTGAVYAHEDF